MGIKVSKYIPTTYDNTATANTAQTSPEGESFQDVLVLNQTALKAMAIDAMVAQSSTGSVNPDAVDAAAIMKFRGTLGSHVQAPVPKDDWTGGTPKTYTPSQVNKTPTNGADSTVKDTTNNQSTTGTQTAGDTQSPDNTQAATDTTNKADTDNKNNTSTESVINPGYTEGEVYNEGNLKCSDEMNEYFAKAAEKYDIDVKLLKSVAYAESNFNPKCESHAGAMGVMQLMPKTAKGMGVEDAFDAEQNIMGGARYLSIQLERFDGDVSLALAAYNAGPGNVRKYGGIPPFEETQNYVKKVLKNYQG